MMTGKNKADDNYLIIDVHKVVLPNSALGSMGLRAHTKFRAT